MPDSARQEPAQPDDLTPSERWWVALNLALPFADEFAPIVAEIRARHHIRPPTTRGELRANLARHSPEGLEPELAAALSRLDWPEDGALVGKVLSAEHAAEAAEVPIRESPARPEDVGAAQLEELRAWVDDILVKPLARYIVAGLMETPKPRGLSVTHFFRTALVGGEPLLIVYVMRLADPRTVGRELAAKHREVFGPPPSGERRRQSKVLARDAWVYYACKAVRSGTSGLEAIVEEAKAIAESLGEEEPSPAVYGQVAELYRQVFGKGGRTNPKTHVANLHKRRQRFMDRVRREIGEDVLGGSPSA
jgi:hypothetical protein